MRSNVTSSGEPRRATAGWRVGVLGSAADGEPATRASMDRRWSRAVASASPADGCRPSSSIDVSSATLRPAASAAAAS